MDAKPLPARPNLEQYKKQAKDLVKTSRSQDRETVERVRRHHPRFRALPDSDLPKARLSLTDAQLIIAREHGFESWPQFARQIDLLNSQRVAVSSADPVADFIQAACVPLDTGHASGTLERAEAILREHPKIGRSNIYTAAILGDDGAMKQFLAQDAKLATAKGGPYGWDALTYLCFSKYLRLDRQRSDAFVRTGRRLFDAGASALTGWFENNHQPKPEWESAIYGVAAVAQHPELTRLLLEHGADPNDEETPYHVPEGYDNTVLKILIESGKLNADSVTTMLLRKTDWHDQEGIRFLLEHGADPNRMTRWHHTALHHAVKRDNGMPIIEMLFDHGADPSLPNRRDGRSATAMAARRGRGDVLKSIERRGMAPGLQGVDQLIAACAKDDREAVRLLAKNEPDLLRQLLTEGGTLLAEFAGTANTEGVRQLLDLGVNPSALYEGDPYFDIAKDSTALHVAAWRAWPTTVSLLVQRGAPVNALDARGRTALFLAVRACVDSYWKYRRTPESVEALLRAGASTEGIDIPSGYDEVDKLLFPKLSS
jgi:ankyrin repeat protein